MSAITINPTSASKDHTVQPVSTMLERIQFVYGEEWPVIRALSEKYPELYLSGSRISAGCLSSYQAEKYRESDLDIYIVTEDSHRAALVMKNIIQTLDRDVEYAERGYVARLTKKGSASIGVNWEDRETIQEVLQSFDMTHAQVAWHVGSDDLITTPAFDSFIQTGVSEVTRDTIYSRVKKAINRGFRVKINAEFHALKMDSYEGDYANREPVCTLQEAIFNAPEETALRYHPLPPAESDVWYCPTLEKDTVDAAHLSLEFWAGVLLQMHPAQDVSFVYGQDAIVVHRSNWTMGDYGSAKLVIGQKDEPEEAQPEKGELEETQPAPTTLPTHQVTLVDRVDDRVYLTVKEDGNERIVRLTRFLNHPEFAFHQGVTRPEIENGHLFFYMTTKDAIYQLDYYQFSEIY